MPEEFIHHYHHIFKLNNILSCASLKKSIWFNKPFLFQLIYIGTIFLLKINSRID